MFRKIIVVITFFITGAFSTGHQARAMAGGKAYAIVVSKKTHSQQGWRAVVEALEGKYQEMGVEVLIYRKGIEEVLPRLQKLHPKYTCFVAKQEETTREFVAEVHRLTRRYDADAYCDTLWGILTGYDAGSALSIAKTSKPLVIGKVASGTEFAAEMVEQGVWYDELKKNLKVEKQSSGRVIRSKVATDTTKGLVDSLNVYKPDLFIASGHGTERGWQIGFRFKSGFFKSKKGQLYGIDTKQRIFNINSPNAKIYMPIGNCLIGHVDSSEAIALAWMKSAGVKQMLGYTVPTWYGYSGWGCLDYFVEQPGKYTFAEGFHASEHALMYRLLAYFPELARKKVPLGRMSIPCRAGDKAKAAGLKRMDGVGLVHDRDVLAFYGDPAWSARMAKRPNAYDQHLTEKDGIYTFKIIPKRGGDTFKPINMNGAQRGWRPMIGYLPWRVKNVEILSGGELKPVITDDFILVPNPRTHDGRGAYVVRFKAKKM